MLTPYLKKPKPVQPELVYVFEFMGGPLPQSLFDFLDTTKIEQKIRLNEDKNRCEVEVCSLMKTLETGDIVYETLCRNR